MVRAPCYDENGVKKGAWSKEEDDKLRSYIQQYGHWNWREVPKFAGLSRCGKSCRLRWMNYLRPNLKHGNYTKEEEDAIINLHQQHGNKWSLIAAKLPGRTDNEIKNYWHTQLKKRMRIKSSSSWSSGSSSSRTSEEAESPVSSVKANNHILESCPFSPTASEMTSSPSEPMTRQVSWWEETFESSGDFWTEPFVSENTLSNGFTYGYGYDCLCEDDMDLLYQVMQELPPQQM